MLYAGQQQLLCATSTSLRKQVVFWQAKSEKQLPAAVMEGEAAGLPDGDLAHVKGALADAQRALARANLEFAIRHRNEELMTAAITEGERLGLRPEILEHGRNELFKQRRRLHW